MVKLIAFHSLQSPLHDAACNMAGGAATSSPICCLTICTENSTFQRALILLITVETALKLLVIYPFRLKHSKNRGSALQQWSQTIHPLKKIHLYPEEGKFIVSETGISTGKKKERQGNMYPYLYVYPVQSILSLLLHLCKKLETRTGSKTKVNFNLKCIILINPSAAASNKIATENFYLLSFST